MASLAAGRSAAQQPNAFTATLESHDEPSRVSWLRWRGLLLRVPMVPAFAPGSIVGWAIPTDQVRLPSNSGRPARVDDTPFRARLVEVAIVRGTVLVTAQTVDEPTVQLVMTAAEQVARDHGVLQGAQLMLRLRGQSISVMPVEALRPRLQ